MDGTLALHGNRDPYRWQDAEQDGLNSPVHRVLVALVSIGDNVFFLSGRPEAARTITERWLSRHFDFPIELRLRRDDDSRPDQVVKADLYRGLLSEHGPAAGVFDDRQRVVEMWRREFGLSCFQVAEGQF